MQAGYVLNSAQQTTISSEREQYLLMAYPRFADEAVLPIEIAVFEATEQMEETIIRWMHRIISNKEQFSIQIEQQIDDATGRLQVRPTLVRAGDDAQIYWNVTNVTGCTVTGTNGSSWSGASSGASGQNTGTILTRTTFTLHCTALPTGNPPTIDESVIVNVAPSFNEN